MAAPPPDPPLRLTLPDGTPILLRPIAAEDKPRFLDAWLKLSPDSRYHRFFTPLAQLSPDQLRFFTEADQIDHIAWAALDERDERLPGLGVGRFIRLADQPHIAEFALTVIDEFQSRGLGRLLLAALYLQARARGILILRGEVLWRNHRFRQWLLELGARLTRQADCDVLDLPVVADPIAVRDTAAARRFADALRQVHALLVSP